jgi:hypothetical protein
MGTKIYNSALTKELREGAKIQSGIDSTPSEIADKVVPVMEVNPKLLRNINVVKDISSVATGAVTIYTTPTNQDFYLTNIVYCASADVTADNVYFRIIATINGQAVNLINMRKISLREFNQNVVLNLPLPLKIDRGTTIQISSVWTVGSSNHHACIYGYIDEQTN